MADPSDRVIIPYTQFLEFLERRRRLAGDGTRPQPPTTTDADTPPVPNHPPAPASPLWRTS